MTRIPLADTLTDVLGAVLPSAELAAPVRVTSVSFDLPLEVSLAGPELLANLPRWRWTTDFDSRPGRLRACFDVEISR